MARRRAHGVQRVFNVLVVRYGAIRRRNGFQNLRARLLKRAFPLAFRQIGHVFVNFAQIPANDAFLLVCKSHASSATRESIPYA